MLWTTWLWFFLHTVKILSTRTDRSEQTVQTQIRLLQKEQSDQGLHCLPFHLHLCGNFCIVNQNCSIVGQLMVFIFGIQFFRTLTVLTRAVVKGATIRTELHLKIILFQFPHSPPIVYDNKDDNNYQDNSYCYYCYYHWTDPSCGLDSSLLTCDTHSNNNCK